MRIAWLSSEPMTQGTMGVTGRVDMVRQLTALGHRVDVICGAGPDDRPFRDLRTSFLRTRYIPFAAWLTQWPRVRPALDELDEVPEVLVTDFALLPPVLRWARGTGSRVVLDIRSQPVEAGRIRTAVQAARFSLTIGLLTRRVQGLSAVSEELLARAARHATLPETRTLVWKAGCRWCDEEPEAPRVPAEWPAELEGRFVALYHGSLTAGRGVLQCVEALAEVSGSAPELALVFLGSGATADDLRELAGQRGVGDRVFVIGPVDHDRVADFIRSSNVGLVPLPPGPRWEVNWPVKLTEYLCLGLPVILTDILPHRIVPADAPFASWCGAGTAVELGRALLGAYAARAKGPELSRAAREWARPRLGVRAQARDFDGLVREVGRDRVEAPLRNSVR